MTQNLDLETELGVFSNGSFSNRKKELDYQEKHHCIGKRHEPFCPEQNNIRFINGLKSNIRNQKKVYGYNYDPSSMKDIW